MSFTSPGELATKPNYGNNDYVQTHMHVAFLLVIRQYAQLKQGQVAWEEDRDVACHIGRKLTGFIGVLAKGNSYFCHSPFLMQNMFMLTFRTKSF